MPGAPETEFRIGSVSKQFTAAAVLLLARRGPLELTDPVQKYLPEWPSAWAKVSIHLLLSHTAGLPRLTTRAMLDVSTLSLATTKPCRFVHDLYAPGEERQPLDAEPGERWSYSKVEPYELPHRHERRALAKGAEVTGAMTMWVQGGAVRLTRR